MSCTAPPSGAELGAAGQLAGSVFGDPLHIMNTGLGQAGRTAWLKASLVTRIAGPRASEHHLVEAPGYLGGDDVLGAAFDQTGSLEADERVGDRELALVLLRAERTVNLQFGYPPSALGRADQHAFKDGVLGVVLLGHVASPDCESSKKRTEGCEAHASSPQQWMSPALRSRSTLAGTCPGGAEHAGRSRS